LSCRPSGRFSAGARVRSRSDFQRVYRTGLKVLVEHFVFLMSPAPCAGPRLGVTASRKVGNAVVRNRAKRLVREAFRTTRDLWQPGVDVVVIVRRSLGDLRLDAVVAEWRRATRALNRAQRQLAENVAAGASRASAAPPSPAAASSAMAVPATELAEPDSPSRGA
jgi:ribonuclease P protein component